MKTFYQEHCTYLPAMLGWFVFSSLLSTYNKYVFGNGHMAFPCPLLLTSIHFSIQWMVSHWICELFPVTLGTDRLKQMTKWEWASISIPCGLVTALDVGLSNLSLKDITLTFYTMVKSSTPIFVLGWAYVFGIEKITWPLIGVIMIIASGEFLTVLGEVDFVLRGFITCLIASILSGARWTLVQKNLQTMEPPLKSTLVTMRLLSPSMFWSMLCLSIIIEHPWNQFGGNSNQVPEISARDDLDDALFDTNALDDTGTGGITTKDVETIFFLGAIGGLLAIAMVLCEFYLILHSSAVVLMIGGVIKELTTILIGVSYFGDQLNLINVLGVCIVFLGVICYKVVFHYEKLQKKEESAAKLMMMQRKENVKLMDSDDSMMMNGNGGNTFHDEDHEDMNGSTRSTSSQNEVSYSSSRSVELVDRSSWKHSKNHNKNGFSKMTEEIVFDSNKKSNDESSAFADDPLGDSNGDSSPTMTQLV